MEIEFLLGVAPVLTDYLVIFQSEEPLIHCMFDSLKTMLLKILGRFIKPDRLKGITAADMVKIELEKEDDYLPLESMDIGAKTKCMV